MNEVDSEREEEEKEKEEGLLTGKRMNVGRRRRRRERGCISLNSVFWFWHTRIMD